MRDYGGGQLLVIACQDALSGLQQGDPAARLKGLGTLVNDHHVEVALGQQLQGAVGRRTWWKQGAGSLLGHGCFPTAVATPEETPPSRGFIEACITTVWDTFVSCNKNLAKTF